MKKNLSNIILIAVFLIGLSLLLYPTASDYWNSLHQSKVISEFAADVEKLDQTTYDQMISAAKKYNEELLTNDDRFHPTAAERKRYERLLNISKNGVIGYIEIPSIKKSLAIYHGVDEAVLQVAVGHIAGSSLPVGGESTHSVISAHRGLPSAKLFTNLDKLAEGDIFLIRVLDETLTYEVDQILIVEPHEVDSLAIEPGKDYCTLVTCTPYGINTHRLLVRGHRIENQADAASIRITADAMQVDPVLVAPMIAAPMLLLLLIGLLIKHRKR